MASIVATFGRLVADTPTAIPLEDAANCRTEEIVIGAATDGPNYGLLNAADNETVLTVYSPEDCFIAVAVGTPDPEGTARRFIKGGDEKQFRVRSGQIVGVIGTL